MAAQKQDQTLTIIFQGQTQTVNISPFGSTIELVVKPSKKTNDLKMTTHITPFSRKPALQDSPGMKTMEGVAYLMYGNELKTVGFAFDYPENSSPTKQHTWFEYYMKIKEEIWYRNEGDRTVQFFSFRIDHCEEPFSETHLPLCAFESVALLPPLSFPFFEEQATYVQVKVAGDLMNKTVHFNEKTTFGEFLYRLSIALGWKPDHFQVYFTQKKIMKGKPRSSVGQKKRKTVDQVEEFVVEKQRLVNFSLSELFIKTFHMHFKELPHSTQIFDQFYVIKNKRV